MREIEKSRGVIIFLKRNFVNFKSYQEFTPQKSLEILGVKIKKVSHRTAAIN